MFSEENDAFNIRRNHYITYDVIINNLLTSNVITFIYFNTIILKYVIYKETSKKDKTHV